MRKMTAYEIALTEDNLEQAYIMTRYLYKRYEHLKMDWSEIFSLAQISLCRVAMAYDPNYGYPFYKLARKRIAWDFKKYIHKAYENHEGPFITLTDYPDHAKYERYVTTMQLAKIDDEYSSIDIKASAQQILSPDEYEIFIRYYFNEKSQRIIANEMYMSESTVYRHIQKIQKKAKQHLREAK